MYKVFRAEDMPVSQYVDEYYDGDMDEAEEALSYAGQYTNYADDYFNLPDIREFEPQVAELMGLEGNASDEDQLTGYVVYWCETADDVVKAVKATDDVVGGIADPDIFTHKGKEYVMDISEWEGVILVFPEELIPELRAVFRDHENPFGVGIRSTLGLDEE